MWRHVIQHPRRLHHFSSIRRQAASSPISASLCSPHPDASGSNSLSTIAQFSNSVPDPSTDMASASSAAVSLACSSSPSPQLYELNPTIGRVVARNFLHALHVVTDKDDFATEYTGPWAQTMDKGAHTGLVKEIVLQKQEDLTTPHVVVCERPLGVSSEALQSEESLHHSQEKVAEGGVNVLTMKGTMDIEETENASSGTTSQPERATRPLQDREGRASVVGTTAKKDHAATAKTREPPVNVSRKGHVALAAHTIASKDQKGRSQTTLELRMTRAMRDSSHFLLTDLFYMSKKENTKIDLEILRDVFFVLLPVNPLNANDVLRRYRQLLPDTDNDEATLLEMYRALSGALGYTDLRRNKFDRLVHVLDSVKRDLNRLGTSYQRSCYPKLLVSVARHNAASLRREATNLYRYMMHNKYDLEPEILEEVIATIDFTGRQHLPFADFLSKLVKKGCRPAPDIAIPVLVNLYPFDNYVDTRQALQAIVDLQASLDAKDRAGDYAVDIGTLELIAASAARRGNYELNLLLWDLMDMLGYAPTEAIYESTIQGFSMTYRQDHNVLSVLGEMESKGFVPSRALITSVARSLRFSTGRVDNAYHLLTNGKLEGSRVTVASLNIMLCSCAGIADLDRVFATLDDFQSYGLEPDVDSYSFVLEALTRSVNPDTEKNERKRLADALAKRDAFESIMGIMDEKGLELCPHCIEQYVVFLLFLGEREAAVEFLVERLDNGTIARNKTILILATACGDAEDFDMAVHLASRAREPLDFLQRRIEKWKQGSGRGADRAIDVADPDAGVPGQRETTTV